MLLCPNDPQTKGQINPQADWREKQIGAKWILLKNEGTNLLGKKPNSFVRFLEEIEDTKSAFEINWPLL